VSRGLGLYHKDVVTRASSASHTDNHDPNSTNGEAPDSIDGEPITRVGLCEFPVLTKGSGKLKLIELRDERQIEIAPGFRTTITNAEETENQFGPVHNTAAVHFTPLPNGETLVVFTGQIFLLVFAEEEGGLEQGIYLTTGRTTFRVNAEDEIIGLVTNQGQLIDVCAILA
jgi:hypothetical protein